MNLITQRNREIFTKNTLSLKAHNVLFLRKVSIIAWYVPFRNCHLNISCQFLEEFRCFGNLQQRPACWGQTLFFPSWSMVWPNCFDSSDFKWKKKKLKESLLQCFILMWWCISTRYVWLHTDLFLPMEDHFSSKAVLLSAVNFYSPFSENLSMAFEMNSRAASQAIFYKNLP